MGLDIYLYRRDPSLVAAGNATAGEYDETEHDVAVELPSNKHPDHYFKIGYFRSSYNNAGINHVLSEHCGTSLYGLFAVEGDDYVVRPDWQAARQRVIDCIVQFASALPLRSCAISAQQRHGSPVVDGESAMAVYRKELEQSSSFDSYSNGHGHFYRKDPISVRAAIAGVDALGGPCVWLIFGSDLSYYAQALEVILETIDYVLAQPDPENYLMHWSG